MQRRRPMRPAHAIWLLVPLLVACGRQPVAPPTAPAAPNLGGTYRGEDGELRTVVTTVGRLAFGGRVEGPLPAADELVGYEFEGAEGAIPLAELSYEGASEQAGLALYGPRSQQGVWGDAVASAVVQPADVLLLEGPSLASSGSYLLLVRTLGHTGGGHFVLQLGCRGTCPAPTCPDVTPCDLVCERGFVSDDDDCRVCECVAATECVGPDDCTEGERCNAEGRCERKPDPCATCPGVYEPVCGVDRRTYGNACRAECVGVEVAARGPCPEPPECDEERRCPMGLVCEDGRCQEPRCDCADEPEQPVCSRSGRSWRNLCELRCRPEEELAYLGPCREGGCASNRHCPEGLVCQPIQDDRVLEQCARDPRSPDCWRECRAPAAPLCSPERECPEGMRCHPTPIPDLGLCLQPCRAQAPEDCPVGTSCVIAADLEVGSCLPHCNHRGECPSGAVCERMPDGEAVCAVCECPQEPDPTPVCGADGRTYPSACAARCAGQPRFAEGACEEPSPCVCPPTPAPVCGADGVVYNNRCELACAEQRPGDAERCWPDPLELGCRSDEDCLVTGCDESVCAAAPTRSCPRYSLEAACHVRYGACGCQEGRCAYGQTAETRTCVQRTREHADRDEDPHAESP